MLRNLVLFFSILALLAGCRVTTPQVDTPSAQITEEAAPAATTTTPVQELTVTKEEPTLAPTESSIPATDTPQPAGWLAMIGPDGNVWLLDTLGGKSRQLTTDAAALTPGEEPGLTVSYCCMQWSTDGELLAYQRDTGTPVESGYNFRRDLVVYRLVTGVELPVVEDQWVTGFSWRPGTHQLAYGLPVPDPYFLSRSDRPDPNFAQGIWEVDADAGEQSELVRPERGYSLVGPRWSPDGNKLAFEEVLYMEGRGLFAYYDFEAGRYQALRSILGSYSWGPKGDLLAYDRMAYTATGEERLWMLELGGGEFPLSPDYDPGYAFGPVFSPDGNQIAYLVDKSDFNAEGSQEYTLYAMIFPDGEPRDLGTYEQAMNLSWSPDGERLFLSAGPYGEQSVIEVSVADGAARDLGPGSEPAPAPAASAGL